MTKNSANPSTNFKISNQFSKGNDRVFLLENNGQRLIFKEILDKNKREREFETLRILEKYLTKEKCSGESQINPEIFQ